MRKSKYKTVYITLIKRYTIMWQESSVYTGIQYSYRDRIALRYAEALSCVKIHWSHAM